MRHSLTPEQSLRVSRLNPKQTIIIGTTKLLETVLNTSVLFILKTINSNQSQLSETITHRVQREQLTRCVVDPFTDLQQ